MSLETVDPPTLAYEAVRSRLAGLAAASAFGTPCLRRAPPEALALSTPHRIAVLPANRFKRKIALSSDVIEKGWRFLILNGAEVVASADSILTETGEHRFGHINEGPFVQATEQAIRRAEADSRVTKGRYEPVLLMVPNLKVVSLWLRNLTGKTDLLMVLPPAPRELHPYELRAADDFIASLNNLARRANNAGRTD